MSANKALAVVKSFDHLVLTCASVEKSIQWYVKYLGMRSEVFVSEATPTVQRSALKFGNSKINLHQAGKEFEPKAKTALPGTADLCFILQDGSDLEDIRKGFVRDGIQPLEGGMVVGRTGALGPMKSLYVRDPDGNLIE